MAAVAVGLGLLGLMFFEAAAALSGGVAHALGAGGLAANEGEFAIEEPGGMGLADAVGLWSGGQVVAWPAGPRGGQLALSFVTGSGATTTQPPVTAKTMKIIVTRFISLPLLG